MLCNEKIIYKFIFYLKISQERMPTPLTNIKSQQLKKATVVVRESSGLLKHSNSSYIVVQDEMLIAEMTNRINEMVIYKEPSEIEILQELVREKRLAPIAEETSNLKVDENSLKSTGHSFEIIRNCKRYEPTSKVSPSY